MNPVVKSIFTLALQNILKIQLNLNTIKTWVSGQNLQKCTKLKIPRYNSRKNFLRFERQNGGTLIASKTKHYFSISIFNKLFVLFAE